MADRPRARRARRTVPLALAVLAVLAGSASGYLHLKSSTGAALRWHPAQLPLTFVVNDKGSDDVPDLADDLAVRLGFAAWDEVPGSSLSFFELQSETQRSRTDWWSDDIRLVLFDEDGSSGLFPEGSGIVATTPLQFQPSTGILLDGDILLNGKERFAAGLASDAFDIRTVVTHEVGHLVGLAHSPIAGATMAPFVDQGQFNPRTLSPDDVAAVEASYPGAVKGLLRGRVLRTAEGGGPGEPVAGAHVWARRTDGRVATGTVTDTLGRYVLTGLPGAAYEVLAQPLDAPLPPAKFTGAGLPLEAFAIDFQPVCSEPVVLEPGTLQELPDLLVPPDAPLRLSGPLTPRVVRRAEITTLNLKVLGWTGAGTVSVPRAEPGVFVPIVTFEPPNTLSVTLLVTGFAPLGLYDLQLDDPENGTVIAPGYIEVAPARPLLAGLSSACDAEPGGRALSVTGSGMLPSSELHLGDALAGDVLALGDSLLSAVTPPHGPGAVDVVLVNAAGEEARLTGGFTYVPGVAPEVFAVFPWAGSIGGNTPVTLAGKGFDAGSQVWFGGVPALDVDVVGPHELRARTPPLPLGVYDVRVAHGGCGDLADTLAGSFLALPFPDPSLFSITPNLLSQEGGDVVDLLGQHFQQGAVVEFFTDLGDGSGGVQVPTQWLDAGHLRIVSPAGPPGRANVVVRNPDGGAAVLPGAVDLVPLVGHGDRVLGSLEDGQSRFVVLDALAGSRLLLTLDRYKKGGLSPALTVYGPEGKPFASTDAAHASHVPALVKASSKRLQLGELELAANGRHVVQIEALNGGGDFRLSVRERIPASVLTRTLPKAGAPDPGPSPVIFELPAKAGSVLTGKLKAAGGLQLVLVSFTAPDGTVLVSDDPVEGLTGLSDVLAGIDLDLLRRNLKLKKAPLATFGTYQLVLGAMPGTSGPVTGKLRVKVPKDKEVFEF